MDFFKKTYAKPFKQNNKNPSCLNLENPKQKPSEYCNKNKKIKFI
jgi:hypothetical protein